MPSAPSRARSSLRDIGLDATRMGTRFILAYIECSDAIQAVVRRCLATINDPETDEDDRVMTLHTLCESLFPDCSARDGLPDDNLCSLRDLDPASEAEMDREEATFADRLSRLLSERDMTQAQLAEKIGVHQSAISMMLARKGRPQRRTVGRIAEALGVSPESLWPSKP